MSTAERLSSLLSNSRRSRHPEKQLDNIRRIVLTEGLTDEASTHLRPLLWKVLLRVPPKLDATEYQSLVDREPSPAIEKIRNDTFRTLASDSNFKARVSEDALVRLLDAVVWRGIDLNDSIGYVQGMNVLTAPFLYTLGSELEAFYCFTRFIEFNCPLYVQPTLEGVHRGLKLLDKCLEVIDPQLFAHLRSKNLQAEIYAFPSVLTFCACTPPLSEVLHVFDFLLAYGVHMNILVVVAQLFLIRDQLLESKSPMTLLRTMPSLKARESIMLACSFVAQLPEPLYDELARHPYDDTLNMM